MPLSKEFAKIKAEMVKKHGEKKGTQVFYAWVNQQKLDDTKSLSSQKGKLKKGKETEIVNGDLRFNSELTVHDVITEGEKKWCKIGGTAMKVGLSRNKVNYKDIHLSENDGREVKFFVEHEGDSGLPLRVDDIVGSVKLKREGERLRYDGKIRNTIKHPEIVETAKDGLLDVSVDARYKSLNKVEESDGSFHFDVDGFQVRAVCGVGVGGIAGNSVDYAITERFKSFDELNEMAIKESDSHAIEVSSKMENEQLIKEKESLSKEKEELLKEQESMKKELEGLKEKEKERLVKEKEQVVADVLEFNKELKEKDLMEKTITELELMRNYEKKLKEQEKKNETPEEKKKREEEEAKKKKEAEGKGEVEPAKKETEDGEFTGILVEKETGNLTMSEGLRKKLHNEIRERYW